MLGKILGSDEELALLKAQVKDLSEKVKVVDDHIVIDIECGYEVRRELCDTHEKILAWVLYFCDRPWITSDVLRRFISIAIRENGLKYPEQ
ncbi:MAG: hypothetical protein K5905_17440 [Roseibium sp.]|uniref:hypothetical protein n=1 Tax=Roseibium sp. TaxID=1936156 RepID=UPI00262D37B8|nr:hypothetical protein [Roseibium sp.]MCV0427248.1 hypothetical protein [Roseibium sp.]